MNYAGKNFKPLAVADVPDSKLREIQEKDRAESTERATRVLDETYQFDVASFEANALKAERKAFEQEHGAEQSGKKEPALEDMWDKELIDVNPLLLMTSVKTIDLGSGRKLSFQNENGVPHVVFETPSLSVSPDKLFNKDVEVEDITEEKLKMGLNEFFHRLKTADGVTLPARSREAGFSDTTELIHTLEKNILEHPLSRAA